MVGILGAKRDCSDLDCVAFAAKPVRRTFLQPRIDRLTLQREYSEHTLVNSSQRFTPDETPERLNPQRKLPDSQGTLPGQPPIPKAPQILRRRVLGAIDDPQIFSAPALQRRLDDVPLSPGDEVERFNAKEGETVFRGLVQPTDTETALNGYRLRKPRLLDAEAQCALAVKGFGSNGFFVLVNDRQAESLDEEIIVGPDTKVSFVKLVPLVGG